jgi:membrane-bound lytic murein transglycosylase B
VSVPVIGVALDGSGGHRAVPDTDKGAMDLDVTWDRAVGVMQFLPGTWKRYAEDQSGDRQADPQNVYDAALAAAKMLCTHGPGLDTDAALREAYYSYNRSDAYVDTVLARAHEYEQLPVPTGQSGG